MWGKIRMIKIKICDARETEFDKIKELLKDYKIERLQEKEGFNITQKRKEQRRITIKEFLIKHNNNYSVEKIYNLMRRGGKYPLNRRTLQRDLIDLENEGFLVINKLMNQDKNGLTSEIVLK